MTDELELDDAEFNERIESLTKEIQEAAARFEADAAAISNELDTQLGATDAALENFVTEVEKGDA